MGYYSIFINIFLSLYYKDILQNVDDAIIGLCMFFGLMCNGTSSLAAVWNATYENKRGVKKWLGKRHHQTKLFACLYKLYKKCFGSGEADGKVLYGNCKLQRYQYAGHSSMLIDSANNIHDIVKDFMMWRTLDSKNKRILTQHGYLYKKLCDIKGIGPISFNQFWHSSMCLCGLLPPSHIQVSAVGQRSGPAKLIQTFYPNIKSPEALQQQLVTVTTNLNKLSSNSMSPAVCWGNRYMCNLTLNRLYEEPPCLQVPLNNNIDVAGME